jgi:phosphatidylinositol alpha 1,6-mannosyltransferase
MTVLIAEPEESTGDGLASRKQPRVAVFSGAYNHIADGVTRTLNRLVGHLEDREFVVRVFAPTTDRPQIDHVGTLVPVPSVSIPGRPDYRLSLGLTTGVRRKLEAFEPTLIHIATPDLLGLQAYLYARRRGIPVVASYHTHFASYLQYYRVPFLEPVVWRYLRWFYSGCEQVYVPSESMIDVLEQHGMNSNLRLWARGVDTERFAPTQRSWAWRRDLGIRDDEVVIAFVSRLVLEKGLRRMLDVLLALKAGGTPFKTLIVGDGPARGELEDALPDAVFTGYLEGEDLARAYASADVFLFPSDTETFGNATLEAMASGLPVVCADATGSRTLVEDGVTGYRKAVDDLAGFVDALAGLVASPELRSEMGAAGFDRAQSYSWTSVLDLLVHYYSNVIDLRSPSSGVGPFVSPNTQ